MIPNEESTTRVLSIYPTTRGFGFAVLEGTQNPIDWGTNTVRFQKNHVCLEKIERLIDFYTPDAVVSEDCLSAGSRRGERITALTRELKELCARRGQNYFEYSRTRIIGVFETFGVSNKHEIAHKISVWVPALTPYLPPLRKPWMSEDYRMAIFDAMALAMTYFYSEE